MITLRRLCLCRSASIRRMPFASTATMNTSSARSIHKLQRSKKRSVPGVTSSTQQREAPSITRYMPAASPAPLTSMAAEPIPATTPPRNSSVRMTLLAVASISEKASASAQSAMTSPSCFFRGMCRPRARPSASLTAPSACSRLSSPPSRCEFISSIRLTSSAAASGSSVFISGKPRPVSHS